MALTVRSNERFQYCNLIDCFVAANVGDEGGFAPNVSGAEEALELLVEAIKKAGYEGKIKIGCDVASSEFFKDGKYDLDFKNPNSDPSKWITGQQLADLYSSLEKKFPIISIEDPFAEDDWEPWSLFMKDSTIQIVGDDLTVTNPLRIKTAIEKKSCNCLLLKVRRTSLYAPDIPLICSILGQPNWYHLGIHPSVSVYRNIHEW